MAPRVKTSSEIRNTFIDEQVQNLIPELEKLALIPDLELRRNGRGAKMKGAKNCQALATEATLALKDSYPDERPELEREYKSAAGQISKLKKALREAAEDCEDKALIKPILSCIEIFGDLLSFKFSEYRARTNAAYRKTVAARSDTAERIEIDPTEYLERAHTVLKSISEGEDLFGWLDVSCAIAMVTGRRMAEIHLSADFSEVEGESHLIKYSGQLKGKKRRVHQDTLTDVTPYELAMAVKDNDSTAMGLPLREVVWEIPTLVPASLVVHGLQWLQEKGKRFEKNVEPTRVNARWSKVLNKAAKDWTLFEGMTYHKFRASYFVCAVANAEAAGLASFDVDRFCELTLCDSDKTAIAAYKRFNLKEGCVTKI